MKHLLSLLSARAVAAALLLALAAPALPALAQNTVPAPDPIPSPAMIAYHQYDDGTRVQISYSSPRLRDPETGEQREIFGKLEPFGKVWRLGANTSTTLITSGDVEIGGQHVPAGTYTLFAIPNPEQWTFIVNKVVPQWGAFTYDESQDLTRFQVPAVHTPDTYEAFSIDFDEEGANLNVVWDQTKLVVPIKPAG
ncbi:MAG TPA: DUF2911 domain-containing protein [Rhodothermales bacterium]|nr:DUF2911 domain-containing protein [Rhodothermales bacterium]